MASSSFKSKYSQLSLDGIQSSALQANVLFNNKSVIARQDTDSLINYLGNRNILFGYETGKSMKNGDDNIFIGYQAGVNTNNSGIVSRNTYLSSTNMFIGAQAGLCNVNGYSNMFIGHNNSKNLTNRFAGGVTNERIFDNISIGADGSAYGAKTITLGNRTITHEANTATLIGYNTSNIGDDTLLIGSDIQNEGYNSFILHAKGNLNNDLDYYVNINDIFTGFTVVDDGDSFLEFNLDKFIIRDSLIASNLNVTGDFKSEYNNELNNVSVSGFLDVQDEAIFHHNTIFNNDVRMNDELSVRSNIAIEGNLSVATNSEFVGDVNFLGAVTFPTNHTFTNDTLFSSEVVFNGNVNMNSDFLVNGKRFLDYLSDIVEGEISLIDYLPPWMNANQALVDANDFNKDNLGTWIVNDLLQNSYPWLNSNQGAIKLELFNNEDFAPWINKDPKQISLNEFEYGGLVKNWLVGKYQQDISLSNFANDNFIKAWALKEQNLVNLSEFRNNDFIKDWALREQINVNLSEFNNDHYQWLDELYNKINTNTNINDTFDGACYFIKNHIAPWLKVNSENIGLTSFCNDITDWENDLIFHGDIEVNGIATLNEIQTNGITTNGNNIFYGNTEIYGSFKSENLIVTHETILNSNITVDGHFKVNSSLEITPNSNVLIYDPLTVNNTTSFHEEATFYVPFTANGFITEGSNILKGVTSVEGGLTTDSLEVIESTILNSNVIVHGNFKVNDAFEITLDNEVLFYDSIDFNSNITFNDDVLFSEGFITLGSNVLKGKTEIDDLYIHKRIEMENEVLMNGDIYLNDSIFMTNSNITIKRGTYTTFNGDVLFDSSFYANGLNTYGSNLLQGFTEIMDGLIVDSLHVTDEVTLGSNVKIDGSLFVNQDDFVITECNIQVNQSFYVNSLTDFYNSVDFHSNVHYYDHVYFNSNVYFTDFTGDGTTLLNGTLRVNDDVLRIENSNIYIRGKVYLLDELIDIDFGLSNLFVNMDSYFNSNLSVLFENQSVLDVFKEETTVHNRLNVQNKLLVNENDITLSSNIIIHGELNINDRFIVSEDKFIVSEEVNLLNSVYIEDDDILITTSNIEIIGDIDINERFYVDDKGSYFHHYDEVLLEITSNVNLFTEAFFNKDVTISDANFTIQNDGVDVFSIQGSNVHFNQSTLERFQENIHLSGKMAGDNEFNTIEVYTDMIFNSNLVVMGSIIGNEDNILTVDSSAHFKEEVLIEDDLITQSNIYVYPSQTDNNSWWKIFSAPTIDEDTLKLNSNEADLIFRSKNGATMRFHDTFEESIINFTGQHRCTICLDEEDLTTDLIGRIVVSTNNYRDLHNNTTIRINEAIPIVKVAQKGNDKSVFGVIGGIEDDDNTSKFSLGHISFVLNKSVVCKKVMINSVGEGAIWVCNLNGPFENGDYITSSSLHGFGMRQESDHEKNYTVAKITCDCEFDLESVVYKCEEFVMDGEIYRKAFVGCVYCC